MTCANSCPSVARGIMDREIAPASATSRGVATTDWTGDCVTDCTTPPRYPTIRVNLLRAHGSPKGYLYHHHSCRCVACRAANAESGRKYRAEHVVECVAYRRKYYAEHTEENAERCRQYYAEHTKEKAEYDRRYDAEHPEKIAARNHNRRALEANATGTHSAADIKAQYERQHSKCIWRKVNPECAVSLKGGYHVDHVIPLAGDRTSSNGPENIVLSCPKCNRSKGANDPMDWAGVMF